MDRYEIATLAEDYHTKRVRRDALAARNIFGLSPEDAMKTEIAYHIADAEYREAQRALDAAK